MPAVQRLLASGARNRRRAVALAAAGAAGAAAAYYVYRWYWSTDEDGDGGTGLLGDADRPSTSGAAAVDERAGVLVDPRGGPATAALDAHAHLQHHFDSIQEIADATTIPSLLPELARALAAAGEVEASLQRLRAVKAGGAAAALGREEKRALWEGLAAGSLARLAAACWALPMLDLQVRVQLNVLGRHLYLQSSLVDQERQQQQQQQQQQRGWGGVEGGVPGHPPLRPLSAPSQEAFLSYSEHLAKAGVAALAEQAHAAAAAALRGVSLGLLLDAAAVEALFSDVVAALSEGAAAAGWAAFLMPPPAQLRESLRQARPDNRAMLPQADALLVDSDTVGAMLGEVGRIIGSERFGVAVTTGAKAAARLAAQRLSARLEGGSLSLAKLVPLLVAEAGEALAPGGEYSAQLAASPAVRALCAAVYSCGPML